MSTNYNWSGPRRGKPFWRGRVQRSYPPGLRGADIGKYFRDLHKTNVKKETVINFALPSAITGALDINLKTIAKIAARENIPLPNVRKLDNFKNNAKINKATEYKSSDDMSTSELTIHKADVVETEELDKDDSLTPNDAMFKETISIKEEIEENKPNDKDMDYEVYCEAGPSKAADFIPVSREPGTYYKAGPKINSLRNVSDFKYGYEDIITGTFQEKLDECIARGVTIGLNNEEIENMNMALFIEYNDMISNDGYKSMMKFRKKLPTYKKSKEVLEVINNNQVIVISGETGCGKSTQVPQIILDDAICNKRGANVKILVTQPRRIAASSLAIRVSKERGERLGNSVGYAVRLETVPERPRGSIRYCTTGILLCDLEVNQGLTEYSHIILDEVHERDVHIDISMCMLKQVLKKRKDLKLILMSATLDAENLSSYFDNCPLLHIEGLAYPVKDLYLEDILSMVNYKLPLEAFKAPKNNWKKYKQKKKEMQEIEKDIQYKAEIGPWLESKKKNLPPDVYKTLQDSRIELINYDLMVELLIYICRGEDGAILVFLPGIGEITKLMKTMEDSNHFPHSRYKIYPLHSKLPTLEQHQIFERPREGVRKIIIATNIAETSITIDDIVYVVDCGKIKMSGLNVEQNVSTLQVEWISQANLMQRRGRAGRCQPGICYHLLTSYRAQQIPERMLPELQRSNLLEPVLAIKKLRLGTANDALKLVPSPPAEKTVQWAVERLQKCGALDDNETLTPLGWHLARLPVHPAAGKLLLLGALFGCLDRAASVAAVWGFKDPFIIDIAHEREIYITKRNLAMSEPSDHVAISEAILEWEKTDKNSSRSFAWDNFLSNSTLVLLSEMKQQLGDNLRRMGFLTTGDVKSAWENRNTYNLSLFKALVAAALYPNIACVKWTKCNHRKNHKMNRPSRFKATCPDDGHVSVHPSSMMSGIKGGNFAELCNKPGARWLVYWLKLRTKDLNVCEVTMVHTLPLLFFGEFAVSDDPQYPESCQLGISTIKIRCEKNDAKKLFELRSLLDKVLASKITNTNNHSIRYSEFEEHVIHTVTQLMTAEDEQVDYLSDDFSDSDNSEK